MVEKFTKFFAAFPSNFAELTGPIEAAARAAQGTRIALTLWPQMEIFGANIPDTIRETILKNDVVVCDVTKPNLNVYYEAGFAIGLGKPIAPIVNRSFAGATADIQRDGFFDNIGYGQYENSEQLLEWLHKPPSTNLIELYAKPINMQQPLFMLDTARKTDFRNSIISAIKESKVFYRSFDPAETARFSTVSIIAEASASAGVVVPLLGDLIDDASRHNLRAAFLAGLARGMGRPTLLLQMPNLESAAPADFREDILTVLNDMEIRGEVITFARDSLLAAQSIREQIRRADKSALQRLTLGASAAENEFRTLEDYFVETSEFLRTRRGEVAVVAGRKGSGKTAIFFRVRDYFREQPETLVVDLKPESHQLSLFREELLKVVGAGAFDHTLAAFWYFVILSEVLLTLKRKIEYQAKREPDAILALHDINEHLVKFGVNESGDFTSRLNRLGAVIVQELDSLARKKVSFTPERLTNIVFASGVAQFRTLIQKYIGTGHHIVFLFDNIDKGWPSSGIHDFDVRLVRLLIEALDKVRRDFNAQDRDFKSVVFLRNDIYELLLDATPDRGKAGEIRIDWADRAKLRQVIYRRLQASSGITTADFASLWCRYFEPKVTGKDSFEYLVDHSLMRPRFLINILENAVANAINRGHEKVDAIDCIDAVRQHSLYLIDDFGFEIRDVSGQPPDILYSLIGVSNLLTREEVINRFRNVGVSGDNLEITFRLLLWYGVLGIADQNGNERFIYHYEYSMRRLEAEIRNSGDNCLFVVNPAIHVALST